MQALLQSVCDEHKLAVIMLLVDKVLRAAAEGQLPLAPCATVLSDALELLTLKEMQLDMRKGQAAPEEALDEASEQVRPQRQSRRVFAMVRSAHAHGRL